MQMEVAGADEHLTEPPSLGLASGGPVHPGCQWWKSVMRELSTMFLAGSQECWRERVSLLIPGAGSVSDLEVVLFEEEGSSSLMGLSCLFWN